MQKDRAVHPKSYTFLLKEGTLIHRDYLDYSLLLLHTQCHEALRSPQPMTPSVLSRRIPYFGGLRADVKNVERKDDDEEDGEDELA